jgi:hypothetical protein
MKLLTTLSASLLLLSANVFAHDKEVEPTTHSIGYQVAGGGIEYKGDDGGQVGHGYLYYNYKIMPNYYLEVGLIGGEDANDWECNQNQQDTTNCFSDYDDTYDLAADNFDYDAVVVAIKTDMSLSKRNRLYAKVGASFYEYSFDLYKTEIVDEDGVGLFLEAGWEYKFDGGVGLNVSFQHQDLGDLEMASLNFGLSYSF